MAGLNTWNRIRFTAYVPIYDGVGRWFMRARRRAVALLHLGAGAQVLLVGAGTGLDLEVLPPGVVCTATDLTPAMLRRLKRRARRLRRQVHTQVCDAVSLPFPEGSMDAVLLHFVLEVLPDPAGAVREAVRVLRPGGRLCLLDIFQPVAGKPSRGRRWLNRLSWFWFSGLNVHPESLTAGLPLRVLHSEACAWRGQVRLLILEKMS